MMTTLMMMLLWTSLRLFIVMMCDVIQFQRVMLGFFPALLALSWVVFSSVCFVPQRLVYFRLVFFSQCHFFKFGNSLSLSLSVYKTKCSSFLYVRMLNDNESTLMVVCISCAVHGILMVFDFLIVADSLLI